MLYQLPNGKTVHLSLDEILDLTDQDIQYLMSTNAGESINNPFHGSVISKPGKRVPLDEDLFEEEEEETSQEDLYLDDISLDDLPDVPEDF